MQLSRTRIRRNIPTRNDVGRTERRLFDFGELVEREPVQLEPADLDRFDDIVLVFGEDLAGIQNIDLDLRHILWLDDVSLDNPLGPMDALDSIVKFLDLFLGFILLLL